MKRVPVVHRHFAGVIELRAVNDNFRLQFCSDSRARMKRWHVVHSAIVRRSDILRHLIGISILAAVEPDIRLGPRVHQKPENQTPPRNPATIFPENFSRARRAGIQNVQRALWTCGGDVDPNVMDSICVLQLSKWILAEPVRVYHGISTDDAQAVIDALSHRELPLVWAINGTKRVLNTALSMRDRLSFCSAELRTECRKSNSSIVWNTPTQRSTGETSFGRRTKNALLNITRL